MSDPGQRRPALDRPARPKLPAPVLQAGRVLTRGYGMATAELRPWPDYLLIGTKRGGTTSVHFHLLAHPAVLPMFPAARWLPKARDSKGAHYFDSEFERGVRWYRAHFPSRLRRWLGRRRGGRVVVGESSPYYLFHPLAAQRAAAVVPQARLLLALRNPIERTYSHYREQVRNGVERLTFAEALDAEDARIAGEAERVRREPGYRSFPHEQQSYASQSEYADSIERWLRHYPRSALHFWFSEDYYARTDEVMRGICRFLGLPEREMPEVGRLNPAPPAPMDPALRARLAERFAPDVERVSQLLDVRPPWPDFR